MKAFNTKSVHIHKNKLLAARDEWSLKHSWIFIDHFRQAALRRKLFFWVLCNSSVDRNLSTRKLIKNPFTKQTICLCKTRALENLHNNAFSQRKNKLMSDAQLIVLHLIYHYHRVRNVMCYGFIMCTRSEQKGARKLKQIIMFVGRNTSKCSDI